MKGTRKKTLFILIMAIFSTILITTVQAIAIPSTATIDEIDYFYEGDISPEKAEQIVKSMRGITDETIQPFSILCIFGHSKEYATITTTEHNYYSTVPRCKETYSYVEYCTRSSCSYYAVTSEFTTRAGCH